MWSFKKWHLVIKINLASIDKLINKTVWVAWMKFRKNNKYFVNNKKNKRSLKNLLLRNYPQQLLLDKNMKELIYMLEALFITALINKFWTMLKIKNKIKCDQVQNLLRAHTYMNRIKGEVSIMRASSNPSKEIKSQAKLSNKLISPQILILVTRKCWDDLLRIH